MLGVSINSHASSTKKTLFQVLVSKVLYECEEISADISILSFLLLTFFNPNTTLPASGGEIEEDKVFSSISISI
jgi:hypothetical protein